MMQRRTVLAAASAALMLAWTPVLQAAPSATIITVEERGLNATASQIHAAARKAAEQRHWGIASDNPGELLLVYPVNNRAQKYQVTVSVTYGEGSYKIAYVKSRGLNERRNSDGTVEAHRNINRWIANLGKDIPRLLMYR